MIPASTFSEEIEDRLAVNIVDNTFKLKEGDVFLIEAADFDLGMVYRLWKRAKEKGAHPILNITSDRVMGHRLRNWSPDAIKAFWSRTLSELPPLAAYIKLAGPENPAIYDDATRSNISVYNASWNSFMEEMDKRGVPRLIWSSLVTPQRAQTYGIDYRHWKKMFEKALTIDLEKVKVIGRKMRSRIEGAEKVHVVSPAGTDLTFAIRGRPVIVEDGIIDDEDRKKGYTLGIMPTGDVKVAPVEETANGVLVVDTPRWLQGKIIEGLKMSFERGKLKSLSAEKNLEALQGLMDQATGDKDVFGGFMIGLNPAQEIIGDLNDALSLGIVSFLIGYNTWFGGNNKSDFWYFVPVRDATVTVDGLLLVDKGKLII